MKWSEAIQKWVNETAIFVEIEEENKKRVAVHYNCWKILDEEEEKEFEKEKEKGKEKEKEKEREKEKVISDVNLLKKNENEFILIKENDKKISDFFDYN